MLMPARVVATFTDEHKRSVLAKASGMEFRNSVSESRRTLVHQGRIAANEIDAHGLSRFVDCACQLHRIAGWRLPKSSKQA